MKHKISAFGRRQESKEQGGVKSSLMYNSSDVITPKREISASTYLPHALALLTWKNTHIKTGIRSPKAKWIKMTKERRERVGELNMETFWENGKWNEPLSL
jgi:hypothetical protein